MAERSASKKMTIFVKFDEKYGNNMKPNSGNKMIIRLGLKTAFSPINRGGMHLFLDFFFLANAFVKVGFMGIF